MATALKTISSEAASDLPATPDSVKFFRRPSYLLLTTAGTIIVSEILIMTAIRFLPPLGFFPEALLDGTLLSFIVFPSLYFLVFKYLNEQITQNKQLEDELRKALDNATATNQTMSRLLRTVAHEFRTPLGLLTGSTDILDRYWDRLSVEKRFEQNEQIRSAAQQMSNLVNSVIAFNQRGVDTSENSPQQLDLNKVCHAIAAEVETVWSTGQLFRVDVPPECGTVELDGTLFRRILENLLTNAFRYTPSDGEVTLHVSRKRGQIFLEIRDTGIGIPLEDRALIFEAFYRSGNVEGRRGLGLGLSIAQEALARMHGSITVTDNAGGGTTMGVIIPHK
jgi:signal transduction histidine kinase